MYPYIAIFVVSNPKHSFLLCRTECAKRKQQRCVMHCRMGEGSMREKQVKCKLNRVFYGGGRGEGQNSEQQKK